jgi:hypothetical protein
VKTGRSKQGEEEEDPGCAEVSVHGGDHYKLDAAIHRLKSGRSCGPGDPQNLL